jgi:hypothetical protein
MIWGIGEERRVEWRRTEISGGEGKYKDEERNREKERMQDKGDS